MAIARLKPGVAPGVATEALRATNARLFPIWRSSYQDQKSTWGLMDLKARAIGDAGSRLIFVLAAVGLVLLIACANAVNLLIARGAASPPRAGDPRRARRLARPPAAVRVRRGGAAGRGRGDRRPRHRGGGTSAHYLLRRPLHPARRRDRLRGPRARLIGHPHDRERHPDRARAGDLWIAHSRRRHAAGRWPLGDGRSGREAGAARPRRGGVRARDSAARRGGAGADQPRSPEPGPRRRRDRSHPDRVGLADRCGVCDRGEPRRLLEARIGTARRRARRRGRGARRQPAAERERPAQQLRPRRSADACRPEPADLPVGRRLARVLQHRRAPPRARPAPRRSLAAGQRRGGRPGVGQPLLPRRRGARPPLPQRRLHRLPLDHRRRRRRQRQMDRARSDGRRDRLLSVRGHAERVLRAAHDRRSDLAVPVDAAGGEGARSRAGAHEHRHRQTRSWPVRSPRRATSAS